MCGIVGVVRSNSNNVYFEDDILGKMASMLQHRGPDTAGIQWNGVCGLGHQRLSIIDLSAAGNQPMSNENESVWISYNGEVYNFKDLRRDFSLDNKGHKFRSQTDTEVIVHLYEELGEEVVKYLNGMYAFAIWDNRKQTLFLARDPYGIKPLFYTITNSGFWFASEIKALLQVPDYTPRPSLEGLYHFLGFNYIPGSLTAFENITELRPGHSLTISASDKEPKVKRFYDIEYKVDSKMSESDAIHGSMKVLESAVERQLIADVPVGVMLSGGMDSSALTAIMAKIRGDSNFHTFSIGFEDASFDETSYAEIVAKHIGTTHHKILVTPDQVIDLLPRYLAYIDEPYADGSAIPTYLLAQTAKEFITVLLSGEGGDEFYSGYDTHAAYKMCTIFRGIPRPIRYLIQKGVDLMPISHKKLSLEFKAKRFVRGAELDIPTAHFFWRRVLSEDAKSEILKDFERFEGYHSSSNLFIQAYDHCSATDELNKLLYIDFSYHLPDDLMIKNDRMTMAHSLEARVPFTDSDLVNFLSTVPVEYKLKGMQKKHLLRASLKGILPDEIIDKKKVGLEMPYSRWFLKELRDLMESVLSYSKLNSTGLFNASAIRKIWDEHTARRADHGRVLWGLLNYMLWYQIYIEKQDFSSYVTTPRQPRVFDLAKK